MRFPDNFYWGTATASYQVEGASLIDGKGESTWDQFVRIPGNVADSHTGDIACDHYHRYEEDVRIMSDIGLNSYRFSISWPRVLPDGTGRVNDQGLDFYDRLVDALLAHNITPWVTLFHWDFPYKLFMQGGWLNPAVVDWFGEYTGIIAAKLGDRVSNWLTINEPQIVIHLGHSTGEHAPGVSYSLPDQVIATHHLLCAHGRAVQVLRSAAKKPFSIGLAPVGFIGLPKTDSEKDIQAAYQCTFSIQNPNMLSNTWFMDPLFQGKYPADGLELFGRFLPRDWENDLPDLNQPLDIFAVNLYHGLVIKSGSDGAELVEHPIGYPRTTMGWPVTSEVLYWGPKFLYERYGKPIVITENGMASCDWIHQNGKIQDYQRIDFMSTHLQALLRSHKDGVPIKGYFHWSLMDNFEWAHGYTQRFGIVFVEFKTGERILKESAHWYKNTIHERGRNLL